MPMETRWLASAAASVWHAAEALASGRIVADRSTAGALAPEAGALVATLAEMPIAPEDFFRHAAPLAATVESPAAWANTLLAKLVGPVFPEEFSFALVRRRAALVAAFAKVHPRALETLELRAAPLAQQWEARGAGLMHSVARLVQPELIVEDADVVVVQPVLGGGGAAHPLYNSVRIEAVLANPRDDLPEVARLGWLLAQLQLDVPRWQPPLERRRLLDIWPLAMIPPVLAAAEYVELVRANGATLAAAAREWAGVDDAGTIDALGTWWETYRQTRADWPVALAALDRLLRGG